jgi:hypothetical protein
MEKRVLITAFVSICLILGFTSVIFTTGCNTQNNTASTTSVTKSESNENKSAAYSFYKDVDLSYWAIDYINELTDRNFICGYEGAYFKPNASITRAELTKIVVLVCGFPVSDSAKSSFTDVSDSHWAYKYIAAAEANSIITGYENGTFMPDAYVSRAEIAKIAVMAGSYEIYRRGTSFSDVKDNWANDYIITAKHSNIISGYPDGTFLPDKHVTRAEATKIISRALVNFK